jgi:nitrite reductase/ring-hydroxylating ferredoxin subunit
VTTHDASSPPAVGFERLASMADVPEGTLLSVTRRNGEQVCIFNCEGRIGAMSDLCTHQAFPMSAGSLEPDGTVQCSWHGAKFDRVTGEVRQGPAVDPIAIREVRVRDGEIWVGPPR